MDNAGLAAFFKTMTDLSFPPRPYADDPSPWLAAWLEQRGMFLHNAALAVEVVGFVRHRGDWLGVIITPEAVALWLLPGGGELWGEIPAGQRRYVELPGGTRAFLAVDDRQLGLSLQSPLVESVASLPDMAAARMVAVDMLKMLGFQPSTTAPPEPPAVSRRGFFRRLAGKR